VAERRLIRSFTAGLGQRSERLLRGPGDDAAVVRADGVAVTTIDTVVDGVHFKRATHTPADIGHKALATALSDIAAMGAAPGEAYVALGLPADFGDDAANELVNAMEALAAETGTTIAGGDVTRSPTLFVSVSATGWAATESDVVTRDGARPGDIVGVTGELGGSAVGLALLENGPRHSAIPPFRRHLRPHPRIDDGRALARAGATSMIDVSDGIATDARHLATESGAKLAIELTALPLAEGATPELAATGGDDYELLFTCPESARAAIEAAVGDVTWIGLVSAGSGLELLDAAGAAVGLTGFEHL
jgi:thiamine-monophosphate kinase